MVKKALLVFSLLIILVISLLILSDWYVRTMAKEQLYTNLNAIPSSRVGVVLGTSKYLKSGQENLYFSHRINAAVELYKAGKIQKIIVSGDNRHKSYNEPLEMQKSLLEAGVAKKDIVLDYAGLRTLDSMHRAKFVFGQDEIIIISQKFHNERAVVIAQSIQLNAYAYNAQDVSVSYGLKTKLREKFARTKLILDLLFNKQPKFLGEKEEV
ncbi:MAG: YdcF family protein [Flavobacteriaceae bacterium]|nr:YdcF family protein [Flavobacteriaceae bacterium]